jgi:hypothetical protein
MVKTGHEAASLCTHPRANKPDACKQTGKASHPLPRLTDDSYSQNWYLHRNSKQMHKGGMALMQLHSQAQC